MVGAVTAPPAHAAFLALLAAASRDAELAPVVIRPRALDAATALDGGDYDLLLPAAAHRGFLLLAVAIMRAHAVSFSIDHTRPTKRRILLHAPEAGASIAIELWSRLEVRDPAGATARAIPWSALEPRLIRAGEERRLPPSIEALYYLSHLATRGKDPEAAEVRARLAHYRALLAADAAIAGLIDRVRSSADTAPAAAAANRLLVAAGVLQPITGIAPRVGSWWSAAAERRERRRRRAIIRGRVIAVTGPDGVGKSTVIDAFRRDLAARSATFRFKSLFRHNPLYRLVSLWRFADQARARGGRLEKNQFDELNGAVLFRIARLGQPWLRLRAAVGGYQCCDRYYHDLLFTGLRLAAGAPGLRPGWEAEARRIPPPAWHLHLDAGDAVILARKQELSAAGLAAYRDGTVAIQLVLDAPYYTCLCTAGSLESVRATLRLAAEPLGLRLVP